MKKFLLKTLSLIMVLTMMFGSTTIKAEENLLKLKRRKEDSDKNILKL